MLTIATQAAGAARICKRGHLSYRGVEFHADRSEAQASAIDA
jgi:hypothetical protein